MHKIILIAFGLLLATPLYGNVETTCTGAASNTERCLYFFKGYLYGLSEAAASGSVTASERDGGEETFMQRALRTRLGIEKARGLDRQAPVTYCLPEHTSLAAIARQLQDTLAEDTAKWNEENDPILAVLEYTFPC